jgi:glutamate racemase
MAKTSQVNGYQVVFHVPFNFGKIEVLLLDKYRCIGIMDSGVGGLTIARALLQMLPQESFIYYGDTLHLPYGEKTEAELILYARNIFEFFIIKGVKAIVVACGTTSSTALPALADQYSLPILGVIKAGARSSARISSNGKIGVIATKATVNSKAFTKEIQMINKDLEVFEMACPPFVPLVEKGMLNSQEARDTVDCYLKPLLEKGIDTLVLGCTHYPFLLPLINNCVGDKVTVVDIAYETIEELKQILATGDLLNDGQEPPVREFYVSGCSDSFSQVGRLLLGDEIKRIEKIELD